jgi:repressor of nif and glnA expression
MGKYDPAILELLNESGLALPPKAITFNLEYLDIASPAKSTTQRRLRILSERGLVEKIDQQAGYYEITQAGRDYLSGDSL